MMKNFTVIGNMLFCHFKLVAPFKATDNLIEVPPEIVDRIPNYSNAFFGGTLGSDPGTAQLPLSIYHDNGKYYMRAFKDINVSAKSYMCGIYYLKDI